MINSMDELSRLNVSDETTPLGVFLVKSDCADEKLLFRYPYVIEEPIPSIQLNQSRYALILPQDNPNNSRTSIICDQSSLLPAYTELTSSISLDINDQMEITKVIGLTDSAFSNLFGTVKKELCNQKFELKVDNVRFVGHPTLVEKHCFHVVFALKANAQPDVVNSYHELSQNISISLRSEEERCKYFSSQSKIMISCHDDQANESNENLNTKYQSSCQSSSPYKSILDKSQLANELKEIFLQLSTEGIVNIKLNGWINLNFCLSQKVHRKLIESPPAMTITPANIQSCLRKLRPYHTFLLLIEMDVLLESLPQDVSPSFIRLIKCSNPLKNLLELSADADITLPQVFNIVAQLVYWGKATIIFPLCETNHYMLHPSAPTALDSRFITEFKEYFPDDSLLKIMSQFSLGVSLSQFKNPMNSADQESKFVRIIVWMLRRHLLLQLHMYVLFVPLQNEASTLIKRSLLHCNNKDNNHDHDDSYFENQFIPMNETYETYETSTANSSCHSDNSPVNSVYSPANISLMKMDIINELNENSPTIIENHQIVVNKLDVANADATNLESSELILQSAGLSSEEIQEVLNTPSADNLDDIRMFAKLVSYFDGHHHIEDIMYYENLRRSQILTLIDKFRDVLIVCQYEDTTVAELLPYNTLQ